MKSSAKYITTGRVLVALYLLLCAVMVYNIYPIINLTNQSIQRYNSIAAVSTSKLNLMNDLRKNFNLIQSKVFRHLHSFSEMEMREEERHIGEAVDENNTILSKYQALVSSEEEHNLLDSVLALREINIRSRNELIKLSSSGQYKNAVAFYAGVQEKTRLNYSDAVELLTDYVVQDTDVKLAETEKYIKEGRVSINLLLALSVLLAVLTGLVVFYANKKLNRQNAQLAENNKALQTINSELDRFVYSTSHDLRAPLLSLDGLLNLSQEHINSKHDVQQYHETMKKVINQMDETIKEILHYSRNARIEIESEQLDIRQMALNIKDNISHMTGRSNIKFSALVDDSVPFFSDKYRVNALINNLITNAYKYKRSDEPNPYVKFTFTSNKNVGIIQIEDNGEGIADEYKDKIFEMFFRASEKFEGSGLGLYICKEIVKRLQGSIEVKSTLLKGSTFTVRIPNMLNTSEQKYHETKSIINRR